MKQIILKMKALGCVLSLLYTLTPLTAEAGADPFVKDWQRFDGVNHYSLNISLESKIPGYPYQLTAILPQNANISVPCQASSGTELHCMSGESLSRNDNRYSITYHSMLGDYEYFDPEHMPQYGAVYGHWKAKDAYQNELHIYILNSSSPNHYDIKTAMYGENGNHCYSDLIDGTYNIDRNADSTEVIYSRKNSMQYQNGIKFDPVNMELVNPNDRDASPSNEYVIFGSCIATIERTKHSLIFKKVT